MTTFASRDVLPSYVLGGLGFGLGAGATYAVRPGNATWADMALPALLLGGLGFALGAVYAAREQDEAEQILAVLEQIDPAQTGAPAYGFFDPAVYAAPSAPSGPPGARVSADTVTATIGQGMGLLSNILGTFGGKPQSPASAGPDVTAILAQQQAAAAQQTKTILLVGGGLGLVGLLGLGGVLLATRSRA